MKKLDKFTVNSTTRFWGWLDALKRVCFDLKSPWRQKTNKLSVEKWHKNPSSREVSFPSADICSLALTVRTGNKVKLIHVQNLYNPWPLSYSSTDSPSTILEAKNSLNAEAGHILPGDFTLHHLYLSGPSRPTQHVASDQLLELNRRGNLLLTLPRGTRTWEGRSS